MKDFIFCIFIACSVLGSYVKGDDGLNSSIFVEISPQVTIINK
ncbi:Uncharacterised protein [Hafnia alvei]|nr:Uncharacterised protein [Hafnia alvei]